MKLDCIGKKIVIFVAAFEYWIEKDCKCIEIIMFTLQSQLMRRIVFAMGKGQLSYKQIETDYYICVCVCLSVRE